MKSKHLLPWYCINCQESFESPDELYIHNCEEVKEDGKGIK